MGFLIIQLLLILVFPAVIHQLLKDRKISRWLSPVVLCYLTGIILGSLGADTVDLSLSREIQGLSVILAIPLLLMTSDFIRWLPKAANLLGAYLVASISVLFGCLVAFFVFRQSIEKAWMVSSMFFAGFTGTSANLNAAGIALNCPDELLLLINLGDMLTGAAYLIILTSVAHPLLSMILPAYKPYMVPYEGQGNNEATDEQFSHIKRYKLKRAGFYLLPVVASVIILLIMIGLEWLLLPAEGIHETFIILSVTICGILISFNDRIRELKSSYTIGNYFLLVFCVALGSTIDVASVINESTIIVIYAALVTAITIVTNVILAKIFRIDADTAIITSAATIFGPAFIGQVAMAIKNKEIVFSGMIVSMVGIALANFAAIGLAKLLQLLQ